MKTPQYFFIWLKLCFIAEGIVSWVFRSITLWLSGFERAVNTSAMPKSPIMAGTRLIPPMSWP